MELLSDPVLAGIITGAIKFILIVGIIIGVLIVLGVFALFRRR